MAVCQAGRVDADVVVVGDGPAGLAAAAACADRGLRVAVVGTAAGWPNTYGVWADELEPLALPPDVLAARWERVTVSTGVGPPHRLGRAYGLVDTLKWYADHRYTPDVVDIR